MSAQKTETAVRAPKSETARAPKSETARDKFLRLAPARTDAALKKVSLLGNLGGPGYQSEPSETKQIIDALTEAVEEVAHKLNKSKGAKKGGGFNFRKR
jgi:hypothetical protein